MIFCLVLVLPPVIVIGRRPESEGSRVGGLEIGGGAELGRLPSVAAVCGVGLCEACCRAAHDLAPLLV